MQRGNSVMFRGPLVGRVPFFYIIKKKYTVVAISYNYCIFCLYLLSLYCLYHYTVPFLFYLNLVLHCIVNIIIKYVVCNLLCKHRDTFVKSVLVQPFKAWKNYTIYERILAFISKHILINRRILDYHTASRTY